MYAVVGIYHAGDSKPQIMSANGRVVLFDSPQIARHVLPILGNGRDCVWDADGETAYFVPLDPQGVNRLVILTDYDPYNLPPGLPVRSETRLRDWKRHVMWSAVFCDLGQTKRRADGTLANTAIGEA